MAKTTCIDDALDLMEENEYYRIDSLWHDTKEQNTAEILLFYRYCEDGHELYRFTSEQNLIDWVNTSFLEDEE